MAKNLFSKPDVWELQFRQKKCFRYMYIMVYFQSHHSRTFLSWVCPYWLHCVHRVQCVPKENLKYSGSGRCYDFGICVKHSLRRVVTSIFRCLEAFRSLILKVKTMSKKDNPPYKFPKLTLSFFVFFLHDKTENLLILILRSSIYRGLGRISILGRFQNIMQSLSIFW